MRVRQSIEIETAPEGVWPFLSEPEKILQWYEPLQKFEYTGDKMGGVGASFRFEHKAPVGTLKLDCMVTEWVENEVFAFKMTSGKMKSYAERWTLEATPSGSRFTFEEQSELPFGIIGRLLGRLAEAGSRATVQTILAQLKQLAEV